MCGYSTDTIARENSRPPTATAACREAVVSWAGGVTWNLTVVCSAASASAKACSAGWTTQQAISLGCHCGAACLDGPGPYAGQLRLG
jgi:ribokinase